MDENQVVQEKTSTNPNVKWLVLIIGGGCTLLACALLVIALAATFFLYRSAKIFDTNNEILTTPKPVIEENTTITAQPLGNILTPDPKAYPLVDINKMGDPNAPVTVIVYSDFQCIYCMRYWDETEIKIIELYVKTGKVYYEYRSFGDFLGPQSALAAEAAYCASDQGKFWEYHDILFLNWTGEGTGDLSLDRLQGYANAIGLNVKEFSDCLTDGTHKPWLDRDASSAYAGGVRATPSFLINGKLIEGAQPFNIFQKEIEAALNDN